jgi:hypothetical protein
MTRYLPGRTATFLIALAGVITAINLAKGLVDSDGFWHLAAGKLIAEQGVPRVDPFTFTWGGRPWTAHEWLSELLMYRLASWFGMSGLVAVWSLFPALTFAVLVIALRRAGLALLAIAPVALLCALVLTTYVTLRPQSISWLLLAVLLWVLLEIRPRHAPWLLALGPAFALWANLHALYAAGLVVLGVYLAFTLAGRTAMASRRGWVAVSFVAAVAGTVLTPSGLVGLLYPLRYLEAGDGGLSYIHEWNTPDFHEPAHLLLLALLIALGLNAFRATPGWLALLALITIPASLLAMRSAPIAAVFAMPTLAYGLHDRLMARRSPPLPPKDATARRLLDLVTAVAVAVASLVVLAPKDLKASVAAEEQRRFPAASIHILEERLPAAHVFADYPWGGYVAYRLYDRGGRSFIDGRNDMFDQSILEDYSLIRSAAPGWEERLDAYGATAILLRPEAPLTHGIAESAGWCVALRTELEVLLLREGCPD